MIDRKYHGVTLKEHWQPQLAGLFVCSLKGHDLVQKYNGGDTVEICRRCS